MAPTEISRLHLAEPRPEAIRLRFDRGTLVFAGLPHDGPGPELPGAVWDARVGAYRAPAYRHGALRERLARLGVAVSDDVRSAEPVPQRFRTIHLRPYQEAALLSWELAGRRGLIVLPTGSGKTRVALAAIARTGLRCLCLVPTRVLLEQWQREIAVLYEGTIGCYGDGAHEIAPVTVATFESAYRHMAQLGNRFDLLIVDEVHHFGSGARDEALEMASAAARLGLTATPPRAGAGDQLAELVGPVVFELKVGDLAGTFLADFDQITLTLELTPDERTAYQADMDAFHRVLVRFRALAPTASWADFARAAARTAEGRGALAAFRRIRKLIAFTRAKSETLGVLLRRHSGSRVLVFTADNQTAYEISRRHLIMPITCDIGRRERDAALSSFRSGDLRALVSAQVLNEGIDVPDADVAIIVGAALGEREHVQRVGRLLRPAAGKRAIAYELVARRTIEVGQARRRRDGLAARAPAPL
jgi:superfamily II DNA or RNA helicase